MAVPSLPLAHFLLQPSSYSPAMQATGHSLPKWVICLFYCTVSMPYWVCGSFPKTCHPWLHLESKVQIGSVFKSLKLLFFLFLFHHALPHSQDSVQDWKGSTQRALSQKHTSIQASSPSFSPVHVKFVQRRQVTGQDEGHIFHTPRQNKGWIRRQALYSGSGGCSHAFWELECQVVVNKCHFSSSFCFG